MIIANGKAIVEEDEVVYGEYLEMVDKKPFLETVHNLGEV